MTTAAESSPGLKIASIKVNHPKAAADFVDNEQRAHWHDKALWYVREKRDRVAKALPEWETLRERASQIKAFTVANLADLLEQFEENATKLGVKVHWASTVEEHNQIVVDILRKHNAHDVVKSKSMLTEECHLNQHLESSGINVIDTDLGEWIVQLRKETPSHIVLPAIHIRKEEVGDLFHEHLGTEAGLADPKKLTEAARQHLRGKFFAADAAITGVNFALADTGGFVVCTNEGNADMGVSLAKVHIACMGIEKMIPRAADLGVFLRLLARSATGQPITTYSSHFHGPLPGAEMHIVLLDNGRTDILGSDDYRRSLSCIRCGACMNTCPVYRRSGGHSYESTVPGPIGSILSPVRDTKKYYSLPHACTLCASCSNVCPVKINIHEQLLSLRRDIVINKDLPLSKRLSMRFARVLLGNTRIFRLAGGVARRVVPWLPRWMMYNGLNGWGKQRELPPFPKQSFRELYQIRETKKTKSRNSSAE